jgi:SAM-dependent methyltransferase
VSLGEGRRPWLGREIDPESSTKVLEEALDRLFQTKPQSRSIHVLEVGCGDGRASRLIFQRLVQAYDNLAVRLTVLDIDMERVAKVFSSHPHEKTSPPHLHVLRGDMYHLPFPAAGFDFVVALNVFFWAERQRLLAEAARVLKPEGCMLISDLLPRPPEAKRPLITMLMRREQILGGPAAYT